MHPVAEVSCRCLGSVPCGQPAKGTVLSGATLVRFGIYEQDATLGMTLRAATATQHTTAFTSGATVQEAPLSTGGSLPPSYLLKYGTDYYFGGLVLGTLSNGSWARLRSLQGGYCPSEA